MNNIDLIFAIHQSHLTVHPADTSGIFIFSFKQVQHMYCMYGRSEVSKLCVQSGIGG